MPGYGFDPIDVGVETAIERGTLPDQRLEGEDDVVGGDGLAIVPSCFLAQMEGHPGAVGGGFDGMRELSVLGQRFVQRLGAQAAVDEEGTTRRHALEDEWIEAVEGTHGRQPQLAAFWRVGIDVAEVLEVSVVLYGAVNAQCVAAIDLLGMAAEAAEEDRREDEEDEVWDSVTQGQRRIDIERPQT